MAAQNSINSKTVLNLTLKEWAGVLIFLISLGFTWVNWSTRVLAIETDIIVLKKEVTENKLEAAKALEIVRTENREDHIMLMKKLDDIYLKVK